jgi:demethylmenaquinone methyltransferase/2-methoxy-6-polyprenyl-1,4-benzoquinol methylase
MDVGTARRLFDANAETYDRVNTVISLGLDSRWRKWAARRAVTRSGARVLDAFGGTGEVALHEAALGGTVTLADVSPGMLEIARKRARGQGFDMEVVAVDLSANPLSVKGAPFDAISLMWGLRYVDDPARVISNLAFQLTENGRLVIVEFVEPSVGVIPALAAFYFFRVLPWIASVLARRRELYRQLVVTTHRMGSADRLLALVRSAGLKVTELRFMGFGLVCGIVAEKQPAEGANAEGADTA